MTSSTSIPSNLYVLSIDVGITNLAFCVLNASNQTIHQWETIDLLQNQHFQCSKCKSTAKNASTIQNEFFCKRHTPKDPGGAATVPLLKQKAKNISLIDIGKRLKIAFDQCFQSYNDSFHKILIENQISPIATRMKTIQGMIAQYFIMKDENANIEFVSSANKLKGVKNLSYKERKQLSIKRCMEFLHDKEDFLSKLLASVKKDDLADCLLQGLYWLNK